MHLYVTGASDWSAHTRTFLQNLPYH